MNRPVKRTLIFAACMMVIIASIFIKNALINANHNIGDVIDSHNDIPVYYNGNTETNLDRNKSKEGYNYGLKYQCVEFVKRYYYEHLNHKMPNTFGNAKDFFDKKVANGERNKNRDLIQYQNGSLSKPEVNDIVVYDASYFNPYGHVAIVSHVMEDEIVIVQQNAGKFSNSRAIIPLAQEDKLWKLDNSRILGWLRK